MFKDQLTDHRKQFTKFWKTEFSKGITFPAIGEVFDYYVAINDETGEPRWQTWDDRLTPYVHDDEALPSQVHVETIETYRLHYMLERLVKMAILFSSVDQRALVRRASLRAWSGHSMTKSMVAPV